MVKFIEHPYVGQIVIFNPVKIDEPDLRFYKDGHYFDYTYFVDSAIHSSLKKGRIILQTHIHQKIEGKVGHPALDISLIRKRRINLDAERLVPVLQSNRGYAALLDKED